MWFPGGSLWISILQRAHTVEKHHASQSCRFYKGVRQLMDVLNFCFTLSIFC